jgi:hypothetical protein
MADPKALPEDPKGFAKFLRERAAGHAPGYDIAIYARPRTWLALADAIDSGLLDEGTRMDWSGLIGSSKATG